MAIQLFFYSLFYNSTFVFSELGECHPIFIYNLIVLFSRLFQYTRNIVVVVKDPVIYGRMLNIFRPYRNAYVLNLAKAHN